MAPRQQPRRAPAPKAAQNSSRARQTYAQQIEHAEISRSRKAAMLQLKMGRLAHVIGISSGLALAATAVLAYLLENWSYLLEDAPEYVVVLKWLVPLAAGLAVALVSLMIKWEPYYVDRDEPHFIMSIVAVAVPAFFIILMALDEMGKLAFGRPDWLYPASLLGISLTLISLAMTWEGTGRRKVISIVAAIFPPALLVFPIFFKFSDLELASILPMAYLGSAVAVQLSGSMLHIIASSTSLMQREVLKASDGKLREQISEVEKKRKALEYREDALRSKESDLEAYERRLAEELSAVDSSKAQVVALEAEIEQSMFNARTTTQQATKQQVDVEGKLDALKLRQSDIDAQLRDLERRTKSAIAREEKVSAKEMEATRLLLEAQTKEREAKNRLAEIGAEEASIGVKAKELRSLQDALAQREKQIAARESSLDLKSMEVVAAREQLGKVAIEKTTIKNIEQQLLMKQEQLHERELGLKSKEDELHGDMERAERMIVRADKQMNELVDKENVLLRREREVSEKEASLRAAVENLNTQLEDTQRNKASLSDMEKQYIDLSESTKAKAAAIAARDEEIGRRMAALDRRETVVKDLDQRLKAEAERMNSKLRELLEKEKDLHAKETEIGLKQAEIKAKERDVLESVEEVGEARAEIPEYREEQAKVFEVREKRLREKEQEMKSRLYLREKELEKRERALEMHLKKDIEEMEEDVGEEFAEEKVKTGIERLDDLLLGGMPFASNVLYVGPPFIGKETAALLFLAEGLRKGVPIVIVTTSHPPIEIAKEMAPILPTFMEFERLGLVRWIDASGNPPDQAAPAYESSHVTKVKGPDDFDGIMSTLDKQFKDFQKHEHPYFRLAYLSLSLSVTRADEKRWFKFVQELAGKVRQARGVAVYAVERGMHTEQQLESLQHQMTGGLLFKTDKQKTLVSVQGITDTLTRDWIEYKYSNKAIMIGAFSLERIR